jgi:hypothetical protein
MAKAVLQARSHLGVASRRGDPEEIEQARRELAEAKLADFIRRTVDSAPRLSAAQCDRLAVMLRDGAVR